jgi:iron-sulfur cluster repair protein YtfE (RIC family)
MTEASTPDGPLLSELKWVHGMIRRNLQACRERASLAAEGVQAVAVREQDRPHQTRDPLLQLRTICLQTCHFVHGHHGAEDALLVPAVRDAAPHLAAAVDKLEADHRTVSRALDRVEAATDALSTPDDARAPRLLVEALDGLTVPLLEHLSFEERSLAPVLNSWSTWPFSGWR